MIADGVWQISKGVFDRLKRDGVEDAIKAKYWSSQINDPSSYRAIWKSRARAGCQMPYAVYSVVFDTAFQHSTGLESEEVILGRTVSPENQHIQYRQAIVQFACYSKTQANSDESWAIDIASMIVDSLENGKLEFTDSTRFISMIRQGDEALRDDDDNTVVVVSWQIEYELLVNQGRLLA